jgi:putative NIF3 family GTP cyclohydrolase 1 type 2
MKLSHFYRSIIKYGAECDPRINRKNIRSYPDTAILHGDPDTEVKKILVGIDIEVGELLLADRIRQEHGLDLVLSHHPEGKAWANFYEAMRLQVDMLLRVGIDKDVARKVLPNNHMRTIDTARLLDIPFICAHTPADNHVAYFITKLMEKGKPKKVKEIMDILMGIPEYQEAANNLAGPRIILGSPKRQVGKILVEMTGGTEGSKNVFDKLYKVGVRTLISMHLSEEHFKKVKDANLNVVIAGHISSDTLGLNLLLDRIEGQAKEQFQVTSCSGFRRVKRN